MIQGPIPMAVWATLFGALSIVLWVWGSPDAPLAPAMLSGAAVFMYIVAAVILLRGRRMERRERAVAEGEPETVEAALVPVPELSFATVLIVVAIATIFAGFYAGHWALYTGLGMLAFGIGGIIRELRSSRRALRAATAERERTTTAGAPRG